MVTLNKNSVPADTSALNPGGVRLGSCALTSRFARLCHEIKIEELLDLYIRGFKEEDFVKTMDFVDEAVEIAKAVQVFFWSHFYSNPLSEHYSLNSTPCRQSQRSWLISRLFWPRIVGLWLSVQISSPGEEIPEP